jgi:hypothetical protein|tara:strand:+ start:3017 stop:3355 length:339 start_codon:yes stop_codon:yes gene_type:complete
MTKKIVILFSIIFLLIVNFIIFTDLIEVKVKFGSGNLSSNSVTSNDENIENMKLKMQILETEIYELKLKVNMNEYVNNKLKEQYCSYLISTPTISNNTKYLKDCADWKKEDK